MAWTITARGSATGTGEFPNGVSDTFTPTEGNCIVVGTHHSTGSVETVTGWSITFSEMASHVINANGLATYRIWAGFVGASPGSDSVDIDFSASGNYEVVTIEIAGIDSSGTVAAAFPQDIADDQYEGNPFNDITIGTGFASAFGSTTNGTLMLVGNNGPTERNAASTGFTRIESQIGTQETFHFDWKDTEESDPVITPDLAFSRHAAIALEVKEESAGTIIPQNPFNKLQGGPFGGPF